MDLHIERELSKTGIETIKVNGLFLHSKYNPIREAQQILNNEYKPHHLHIVFGYGLGYMVEQLIEKCHFNEPVLIIDPLIDNGTISLKSTNYSRLYTATLNNEVELIDIVDQLSSYSNNVHVITSMNYDKLFPEQLIKVLEIVKNNHFKQGSNIATAKHFAITWQKNLLFNTASLIKDYSLNILKGRYNAPVIVTSGGPSLNKQLPLLEKIRDKVIIICAGSTINALLKNGIEPDYVVSVDGGEPNAKHFNQLSLHSNISLIYSPTNHYAVRNSFKGDCYGFIPSVKPQYQKYFSKRFSKDLPLIDGGGSVAHYALSIARYISNGPISLIGQDLALTNNQTHAGGILGNKGIDLIPENKKVLVEGYYNDQVVTTETMKIMINSFNEPPLINLDRKDIWNCTEGGAKIKSIEQMPFNEFVNEFVISGICKINPIEQPKSKIILDTFLRDEINNYVKVLKLLSDGVNLIEKSKGFTLNQNELNKISKIEKELNRLYKEFNMETLLEPIFDRCSHDYLPEIGETELEAKMRAKNYALDLYQSCINQIKIFLEQITSEEN